MRNEHFVSALMMVGCGILLSLSVFAAQDSSARVAVLPVPDTPVAVESTRVITTDDPATVAFTMTNLTSRRVRACMVAAYVFPPTGQGGGYVKADQRPAAGIEAGGSHEATLSLLGKRTYGSGTTVIVAVERVTFEDGTHWTAPKDLIYRVKDYAASLQLAAPAIQ